MNYSPIYKRTYAQQSKIITQAIRTFTCKHAKLNKPVTHILYSEFHHYVQHHFKPARRYRPVSAWHDFNDRRFESTCRPLLDELAAPIYRFSIEDAPDRTFSAGIGTVFKRDHHSHYWLCLGRLT